MRIPVAYYECTYTIPLYSPNIRHDSHELTVHMMI